MSTQSTKPYIGVTGFMKPEEIVALQSLFGPNDSHQLMVGILVSHKTWNGRSTKYPHLYPPPEQLAGLVSAVDASRAFALVHYNSAGPDGATYRSHSEWAADEAIFFEDCWQILETEVASWAPSWQAALGGFQYNFPLPKKVSLARIEFRRRVHGGGPTRSVLQIWPKLLDSVQELVCPDVSLADFISSEYSLLDQNFSSFPFQTLLYDASGGFGVDLSRDHLLSELPQYFRLCNSGAGLRLAIAGGLCAETIGTYRFVARAYADLEHTLPGLSVDAQGKLRTPDGSMDLDAAKRYIEAAQQLLST